MSQEVQTPTPGSGADAKETPVPQSQEGTDTNGPAKPSVEETYVALLNLPTMIPAALGAESLAFTPDSAARAIGEKRSFEIGKTNPVVVRVIAPSFVSFVEVEGASSLGEYIVPEYLGQNGGWHVVDPGSIEKNDGLLRIHIGMFTSSVRLSKRWSAWGRGPRLSVRRIDVFGFGVFGSQEWQASFSQFVDEVEYCRHHMESEMAQIQTLKKTLEEEGRSHRAKLEEDRSRINQERTEWDGKVSAARAEYTSLEASLTALRTEKANVETAVGGVKTNLAQEEVKLAEAVARTQAEQGKLTAVQRTIEEKSGVAESLDRETADKRNKLDELNRDISLFAVDLKGYGGQGTRQVRVYALFLGLCLTLGLWLTYLALAEVDEIWKVIVADPKRISWDLIAITRFSIFVIYAAAIGALSTLAFSFIRRIMQIHDRSLRLSEISIIARDVIEASLADTGATPQQKVAAFFAARMMMIRNLVAGTFERLGRASKAEKEAQLSDLKNADMISFLKVLQDIGLVPQAKSEKKP